MKLIEHLRPDLVIPALRGQSKSEIVFELASHLAATQFDIDASSLTQALLDREALGSTALSNDIAIPHCKCKAATRLHLCLGRSLQGVPFGATDGRPTHLFFLLVAPETLTGLHLKALAKICHLCKDSEFRARLMTAPSATEMFYVLEQEDP